MQLVELVVELLDLVGHRGAVGVGVGGGAPHVARHLPHLLDESTGARGQFHPEAAHGAPRHVFGEVATALELGQHAQHGHEVAQLVGPRRPQGELALGQLLHLAVQRVDGLVALGEHTRRLAVPVEQTVRCTRHALAHQREELDHLAVDVLQALGDLIVVGQLDHDTLRHDAHRSPIGIGTVPAAPAPSGLGVDVGDDEPGPRGPVQVAPRTS